MVEKSVLETRRFASADAWDAWLRTHHATSSGLWLELAKKSAKLVTVTYADALDVALCHGWIDGQKKASTAQTWLQRFTPRTSRSPWSAINREKVAVLLAAGRMTPAGQAQIDRARLDGRWERAYAGQRTADVPGDLAAALESVPEAKAFFGTLDRANRYAVLYRVQEAKKAETRARRIAQFVAMLARHETLHG